MYLMTQMSGSNVLFAILFHFANALVAVICRRLDCVVYLPSGVIVIRLRILLMDTSRLCVLFPALSLHAELCKSDLILFIPSAASIARYRADALSLPSATYRGLGLDTPT